MDSLVAIGATASVVYGVFALYAMAYAQGAGDTETIHHWLHSLYFESAATILTLVSLGKFLEHRARRKSADAVRRWRPSLPTRLGSSGKVRGLSCR